MKATANADGSITVTWSAVTGAKSYVLHYGNPGQKDGAATFMEYTTNTSYTLPANKVPDHSTGDEINFYVQSFKDTGVGTTTEDQAQYLNAGQFTGSEWSNIATATMK
ncbi:hypothetical protein IWT25_00667 [Secundilactobacillus pentosiphilus]|uniref:Fibronectin type-III domain-containing protein n=1 Tax=Secundilactobacillus pentosiphilus TaxID=1714682 RepID=A0A1Z5IUD0_9LACO|nr:hypothetical protein [Secundilactobacillus pentosiphilus]GAX05363.1 hypothetical protein IWT25_00667 [Secundilactobacillus pentosiphilus]